MNNWLLTLPRPPSQSWADRAREYEDWSMAELLAGRRFAQATPDASSAPMSSTDAAPEPAPASLPSWLGDAQWQPMPGRLPELPPGAELDPFERAAIRTRRSVVPDGRRRRSSMGPPFLNEPPQDYPSYLGPVPRAPEWEQVVPGPTPWSPLAPPPRATD